MLVTCSSLVFFWGEGGGKGVFFLFFFFPPLSHSPLHISCSDTYTYILPSLYLLTPYSTYILPYLYLPIPYPPMPSLYLPSLPSLYLPYPMQQVSIGIDIDMPPAKKKMAGWDVCFCWVGNEMRWIRMRVAVGEKMMGIFDVFWS